MKNKIDPKIKNFIDKWCPENSSNKEMEKELIDLLNSNKDPKYLGIPNICFSLTEKNDKRESLLTIQRLERGFDDSETWSLDITIAKFILPRLIRYRELMNEYTEDVDGFYNDVNKSIRAFELIIKDNYSKIFDENENKECIEGLNAFNKIYFNLWW